MCSSPRNDSATVSSAATGGTGLPPVSSALVGAVTTILTGDTSTSGLTYASDGIIPSRATVFNLIANSGTTQRNPRGIPIDGPQQTVSVTLNLCSATWDTIVTLVSGWAEGE